MVEKCVVFGCSNSRNVEKGISMHKIPSESFWCPFLTSQLRKCQISDASHWLVPNEPTRQKFVQRGLKRAKIKKFQYLLALVNKKDSIFLKNFFENEFFTDMEIYQKKTN